MAESREQELQQAEVAQIEKVKAALAKINNKESRFLFFVPKIHNPAASVYEIYFHASVVKKLGYSVTILTDASDYEIPEWIDKELTNLTHESMEKVKLTVSSHDVIVIPEIFSNVMERTKNLPCIRVGLLQSFDYMLNGLLPGTDWNKDFGIKNIITTSNEVKVLVEEYYGKKTFNINTYDIGVPEYFTKKEDEIKRPVISIVGRNPNEISKVVKLFYSRYPQYSWVTFDSMFTDSKPPTPMRRVDYADRLKKNFAAVWIDRISSFGTFPLECMKAGTIPIGLVPDITPQYLIDENNQFIENSGVWTRDIYALPLLIGDTITKFLDDRIGEEVEETMKNISSKYSVENSEKQLAAIYTSFLEERAKILSNAIEEFEKKNVETASEESK